MLRRIIKVKSCKTCPYRHYDNGGGFTEPFNICEKFSILLDEKLKDGGYFSVNTQRIHPECKLETIKE